MPRIVHSWWLYPSDLSGGIKQKLLVALVMRLNPIIRLADKATSALDMDASFKVLDLILGTNFAIFCIIHNLNMASIFADNSYLIKEPSLTKVIL